MCRIRLTALCLLPILALSGCGDDLSPDLRQLYEMDDVNVEQPPLIVIPGILGSKLRDAKTGKSLWPGPAWKLFFSDYRDLALDIDPMTLEPLPSDIEAYGISESGLGTDFYGQLVMTLEEYGGYVRGTPGQKAPARARRYYLFPYDWRQDNVVTARQLDGLIEQIRKDYADPKLKVDIVAHSMGGLIARYYLRYGTRDVLDGNDFPVSGHGESRIRTVILLGTPNLGSASSLHRFIRGAKIALGRVPTEVLATMPSMYQLFPHSLSDWLVTSEGETLDRDLFDVEIWRHFQWSIFDPPVAARVQEQHQTDILVLQRYFEKRLERARRFVWSLTVPQPHAQIKLVVFGGDCRLTPARLLVEEVDGDSVARLFPDEIKTPQSGVDYERLMLEPGDGQVTKPSLLARVALDPAVSQHRYIFFPLAYSFFLCEDHRRLTSNINFQDNLLNVLLSRERPWESGSAPVP